MTIDDVVDAGPTQAWLYDALVELFGATFAADVAAIETLRTGGYYATSPEPGLKVVGLNTLYWSTVNPLLKNASSAASIAGEKQFKWFESVLTEASAAGDAVVLLGHIPPHGAWVPGLFSRFRALVTRFPNVVRAGPSDTSTSLAFRLPLIATDWH
jgi:sphingomyelin phosphodiesterase